MAVKMVSVKCPECGADLDFEEGRKQAFCSYCGSKIMMDNDNEFTYRYVDEAALKRAQTDEKIRLSRLLEGKKISGLKFKLALSATLIGVLMLVFGEFLGKMTGDPNSAWYMIALVGIMIGVGSVLLWISFYESLDDGDYLGERIRIPDISNYNTKNYASIETQFESAGFTNVTSVPLHDLKIGLLKKAGTVESITIGGKSVVPGRKKYPSDAPVVINYHSH